MVAFSTFQQTELHIRRFDPTAGLANLNCTYTINETALGKLYISCTGIQTIVDAYQKGYDTTPVAFRFMGLDRKSVV